MLICSFASSVALYSCSAGSRRISASPRWTIAKTLSATLVGAVMAGCCQTNDPSCRNVSIGPSKGEVIGIGIGVGAGIATIVAVGVHHAHHTLTGCVPDLSGGTELHIRNGDKTYKMAGNTAGVKQGRKMRLHGKSLKQPKHDSSAPTFQVAEVSKDYGPCTLSLGSPAPRS